MKKILTLVITLMLSLVAVFGATGCGGAETPSAIADGTLTIGYTIYKPMNYFEDNEFVGFDTELAKKFCEEIGVTPNFVEIEWNNKFIDLQSKNIDVIWNGMTITDEVKEKTAVSSPYLTNKQVVVCLKSNADKYTDINSIKNAVNVAVETKSAGHNVVSDAGVIDAKIVKVTAQKDTLLEVASGNSEIAVIDLLMAQVLVGEGTDFANLTFVDVGFENEDFGVAFRKSDLGLAKAFDMFIKLSKLDGSYNTLQAKYFG